MNSFRLKTNSLSHWLPTRQPDDNKSAGGRLLILAGNSKMPGAAILAAKAASRMGAGYIYTSTPEVIEFFPECIPWNQKNFDKIDAVLIGPGLGVSSHTADLIKKLKKTNLPVVIDADALTVAAQKKLYPFPAHWIATPHPGELARFLKTTAQEVQKSRSSSARKAQNILDCILLLKGHHSLVTLNDRNILIPNGNVALAKGGSGDVLGGMIGALLAQGVSPLKALLLACYIHGEIADHWVSAGNDYLSLTPSDLIESLPTAISRLRSIK